MVFLWDTINIIRLDQVLVQQVRDQDRIGGKLSVRLVKP
jgi:hypothetical protein